MLKNEQCAYRVMKPGGIVEGEFPSAFNARGFCDWANGNIGVGHRVYAGRYRNGIFRIDSFATTG